MTTPASAAAPAAFTAGTDIRGRFLWYDLLTPDIAKSTAFYTKVVGWGLAEFPMGDTSYTMWAAPEIGPIGGTMAIPADEVAKGTPAHWLAYIGTPDTDATHALAVQLGATSNVAPRDIPTVGRFAVLTDPQGALFALYTPANDPGTEPEMPPVGQFSWHELITTNPNDAWAFYQKLFGWEVTSEMDMGPDGIYRMYGARGHTYGGVMAKPAAMPGPSRWNLYARVADLDVAVAATKENGGQIILGPMEVPGGDVVANGIDTQGGVFALHQKKG